MRRTTQFCRPAGLVVLLLLINMPRLGLAQLTPESLIAGAVSDMGPYYQDLNDAIVRLRAGDLEGTRAQLKAAHTKAPKLSPPEVMLGNMLLASNQPAAARSELERAVHLYPQDPEAYVRLAELGGSEGRAAEAALLYAKAIEVANAFNDSPKRKRLVQIRAYSGAAALDEAREDWAAARDKLQALEKLKVEGAVPHVRLAKALFKLDDTKEAYRQLQAAHAADEKILPAEVSMAAFYTSAGDKNNAEKWIAAALKKSADNFATQYGLATWYLDHNDLAKAQSYADAAIKNDPHSVEAKVIRGIIARTQKDLKTAEALLTAAHLQSPSNIDANNHLALVLLEKQDELSHKRAVEFADMNHRLNPSNSGLTATLAWVLLRLGKSTEAERLFNAVTASGMPINNESVYFLAVFRKEQGHTTEAERLLELALSREMQFYYRDNAEELLAELAKRSSKAGTPKKEPPAERPKKAGAAEPGPGQRTPAEKPVTGK